MIKPRNPWYPKLKYYNICYCRLEVQRIVSFFQIRQHHLLRELVRGCSDVHMCRWTRSYIWLLLFIVCYTGLCQHLRMWIPSRSLNLVWVDLSSSVYIYSITIPQKARRIAPPHDTDPSLVATFFIYVLTVFHILCRYYFPSANPKRRYWENGVMLTKIVLLICY